MEPHRNYGSWVIGLPLIVKLLMMSPANSIDYDWVYLYVLSIEFPSIS